MKYSLFLIILTNIYPFPSNRIKTLSYKDNHLSAILSSIQDKKR